MNPLTRKLGTAGSALALAASGLFFASSPASAATSCYGSSCSGLDPAASICQNDARTVSTSVLGVELRYSPTCRAAWARYKAGGSIDFNVTVENTAGGYFAKYYYGDGATVWTQMVDDKNLYAKACGVRPEGGSYCSDLY